MKDKKIDSGLLGLKNANGLDCETMILQGFNECGHGELKVDFLGKGNSGGNIFTFTFTRNGMEKKFCLAGFAAKKLAAYIALWA